MGIVTISSETAFARSPEIIYDWHLAIAMRPKLWMFNSVGPLGHDRDGNGGMAGRITVNPAKVDAHHAPIARELECAR